MKRAASAREDGAADEADDGDMSERSESVPGMGTV